MVVSNPRNMRKDSFKGTFFVMNKFPKKEPTNLCKFYDSKGTTKFLWWSDDFPNPSV